MSVTSPEHQYHLKVSLRDGPLPRALSWAAMLVGALLVAGSAGALHPAGDSFAVLRPALAVLGLCVSLALVLCGAWRRALGAMALPGLAVASLVPHWQNGSAPVGPSLTIYQKNLYYTTTATGPIAEDIRRTAPDLVMLQEVHPNNAAILDALRGTYPAQVLCPFHAKAGGVALLSRAPFRAGSASCTRTPGMARAIIDLSTGPLTVGAVHFRWPWPKGQAGQARGLSAEIATLPQPMVIAGDFNTVRWSHALTMVEQAGGLSPLGRAWITHPATYVSIDHVLAPNGAGTTELRPLFGSDHRGVLARIPLPTP